MSIRMRKEIFENADYCTSYSAQLFFAAEVSSPRLVAECSATTTCISWNKESDPICMRPQTAPHGDSA